MFLKRCLPFLSDAAHVVYDCIRISNCRLESVGAQSGWQDFEPNLRIRQTATVEGRPTAPRRDEAPRAAG